MTNLLNPETLKSALPIIAQLATVVVATIAIVATRSSAKNTVEAQFNQKLWERRTDLYLEILSRTESAYPAENLESLRERSSRGEKIEFVEGVDRQSDEWTNFRHRIDAFASDEVRSLFALWSSTLNEYTWTTMNALIHRKPDAKFHEKSTREHEVSSRAIYHAREELLVQIRAELQFDKRRIPRILYRPGISGPREIIAIGKRRIQPDD